VDPPRQHGGDGQHGKQDQKDLEIAFHAVSFEEIRASSMASRAL
jgi:hypothetical protein